MKDLWHRKGEIEQAWATGETRQNQSEYIKILTEISKSQLGIISVCAPGIKFPFYLRAGTSDVRNYWQIFQRDEYGFEVPENPKSILDLGGYVGFAAIYLANRFPEAQLACVEPSPGNFFMLRANTAPYRNIRIFNAAIWDKNTTLSSSGHMAGDWGAMFGENDEGEQVEGVSIDEIMSRMSWSTIDFLKCDCEGAEVQIFANKDVAWRKTIKFSTVETHDRMIDTSSSTVRSFFSDGFIEEKSGEFLLFKRDGASEQKAKKETYVFDTTSAAKEILLRDVSPETWGLYFFDRYSFQLHPNAAEEPPAKVETTVMYSGEATLAFDIGLMNKDAYDVKFSISVVTPTGSTKEIFSKVCKANELTHHEVDLPKTNHAGSTRLVFSTELAGGGLQRKAWARWFNTRVCEHV